MFPRFLSRSEELDWRAAEFQESGWDCTLSNVSSKHITAESKSTAVSAKARRSHFHCLVELDRSARTWRNANTSPECCMELICNFPKLPDKYDRALREAVSFVLDRSEEHTSELQSLRHL